MVAKAAKRDRKAYQAAYYQRNKKRLNARRTAVRREIQAEANGVKPKAAERLTGAKAAKAIAGWSAKNLVVPTPPRQGEKFRLADWQVSFLKDAFGPSVKEAALSIARRNGKSFLIAVVLLAHLCGPMRRANWRAAVSPPTSQAVTPSALTWAFAMKPDCLKTASSTTVCFPPPEAGTAGFSRSASAATVKSLIASASARTRRVVRRSPD